VFYINPPFGVLALLGVIVALPSVRTESRVKVDWLGSLLLAASLIPLLLAFTWAGSKCAWGSTTLITMFAGAAVSLVLFFLWEGRAAEPVLPASLFKNSIFTISALASLLAAMGMFGSIMFIPLFFQGVLGLTATHSGQFMTPMMLSLLGPCSSSAPISSRPRAWTRPGRPWSATWPSSASASVCCNRC